MSFQTLQFKLVNTDGGQHSQQYRCENMLIGNSTVYCTQKASNINIVLRHESDQPFCLEGIVVKGPEQHFTAPIGTGCVFVSFDVPDVSATTKFDSFEEYQYEDYIAEKKRKGEPIIDSDPVVFFDTTDCSSFVSKMVEPKRYGRYIHVKLIRSSNFGTNIDIQYIGFLGSVGPEQEGATDLA
eukprot:TRINITY_DN10634_c0_g1_i1.p1 TRINITY_DN10634_c0_g1~~TRINITY_DN10634_c0_g1_i1.p1  ORF type:complete len:183 (+),score=27.98 TRINITY_DN10634_c0_g1_i1:54-602(+)